MTTRDSSAARPVKLVNESAMGVYCMSWTSPKTGRCVVTWADGLDQPMFEFYSPTRGSMTPPVPIRNPERFGWRTPRKIADFKAFVQAWAQACEADD